MKIVPGASADRQSETYRAVAWGPRELEGRLRRAVSEDSPYLGGDGTDVEALIWFAGDPDTTPTAPSHVRFYRQPIDGDGESGSDVLDIQRFRVDIVQVDVEQGSFRPNRDAALATLLERDVVFLPPVRPVEELQFQQGRRDLLQQVGSVRSE